jgi:endonuclease YncB( thermonuclease family)
LNPPVSPISGPSRPRSAARATRALAAVALAAAGLSLVPLGHAEAAAATTSTRARVVKWIDGDTVRTTAGDIRLIGMDSPERGERCYQQATRNVAQQAPVGSTVSLVKVRGRDNVDRYGRKLRYVQRGSVDVGLRQIRAGFADAAYDSGSYGTHPRRANYRRTDRLHADRSCVPAAPAPVPSPTCDPSYPGVCIPPAPPDLDCGDVSYTNFRVVGSDPHGFDGNDDGVGCES